MLDETIAVLGDTDLMTQLATAEADLAAGRVETQDDLEGAMRSRGTSAWTTRATAYSSSRPPHDTSAKNCPRRSPRPRSS